MAKSTRQGTTHTPAKEVPVPQRKSSSSTSRLEEFDGYGRSRRPRPGTCGHFVELRAVRRSLIVEAACWVIHMPLDRRRDLVVKQGMREGSLTPFSRTRRSASPVDGLLACMMLCKSAMRIKAST